MKRLYLVAVIGLTVALIGLGSIFLIQPSFAIASILPAGFQVETIVSGINKPTNMAFTPDGRIFITEKDGAVRIVKNGVLLANPLIKLSDVNTNGDHSLLGIAIDPDFSQNGYIYLSYTHENNPNNYTGSKTGRIVRLTVVGDTASESSEIILVGTVSGDANNPSCENFPIGSDCIPSDSLSHSMGGLMFGSDGKLYATLGDGATFDRVDPRALRSQNLDSLAGKMLRINTDGTAPSDNPFYNGDPHANRSKVWVYGLRNAYRFNFRPSNGSLYIGDVGWKTWEEINIGKAGANYGWPCREGFFKQPEYNCDVTNYTDPLYAYDHRLGTAAVTAGSFPANNVYPTEYMSNYFFGDVTTNTIKRMVVDSNDNLISVQDFYDQAAGPVDIITGPDGYIYFLSIYTGQLRRITYTTGNQLPIAHIVADPLTGASPLTVNFSSSGSSDADSDQLTYAWNFGDNQTSTDPQPQHIYTSDGNYTATLTVNDSKGGTDTKSVLIRVAASQVNNIIPHHVQTTVAPLPSYIGRDAVLSTTISNSGAANPFIVDLEIYDANNVKVAQKVFDGEVTPTNSSKNYSFNWFPSNIGNYRTAVGLFQENWSGLYEWTNDAVDVTILNRAPDITPTSTPTSTPPVIAPPPPVVNFAPAYSTTTVQSATVNSDQSDLITTSVQNTGGAGTMLVDIEVYKDGNKVGQQYFDTITFAQNETKNFTFNWSTHESGIYTVSVGLFKPSWSGLYAWVPGVAQISVTTTPPLTSSGADIPIYTASTLGSDWQNWSWDTDINLTSELQVHYKSAWAGFYLHNNNPLNTTGYSSIEFNLNGGSVGNQHLQLLMYDGNGNLYTTKNLSSYIPNNGSLQQNSWTDIVIPLSDIQSQNKSISGFALQGIDGSTQADFLVKSILLKK